MTVRMFSFLSALFCFYLTCSPALAQLPRVTVGIVVDGPLEPSVEFVRDAITPEVLKLTSNEFKVEFPADKTLNGDGSAAQVKANVDRLLADPAVDMVICAGHMSSYEVARRGDLPKPVFAPIIIDPAVQGIPRQGNSSGVKNLSYITFPADIKRDLETCQEIAPFAKVAIMVSRFVGEAMPQLRDHYLAKAQEVGVEGVWLPAAPTAAGIFAALPGDVDAVLIALPLKLAPAEFERLVQGLIERKLPSFSILSMGLVERGLLAELHQGADIPRLARRLALNIQRVLLGEEPGSLPVVFSRNNQIAINMATARAMGIYPSWRVMTEAERVGEAVRKEGEHFNLAGVVRQAVRTNLDLAANLQALDAGAAQVRGARAGLLPQVDLGGEGVVLDEKLASGFQPERTAKASATLSQLLYSEPARANWAIQGHLQKSRRHQRQQLRLDVVQEAATGYINVLRALTFERVQAHNLELSRSNLSLAQVRKTVGSSGPAEVYRWESEIANGRKRVIEANAQRNLAEIALNRILHRPLEAHFTTAETGLHSEGLITRDERFTRYLSNQYNFKVFRAFMVEDGLASAPELQAFDAAIAAQERSLRAAQRAFWLPAAGVQGQLSNQFYEDGIGAPSPSEGSSWTLGLSLNYPLFSGGGKFAARTQAQREVEQLRLERQALAERIEQRIRSAVHTAGASYAGIKLSESAALAAHKNLELVKDAYGQGAVSILDLLDAQNAAILAEEGSANAVYDFLIHLMEVERAIGKFYFFCPPEEGEAWFGRLEAYFMAAVAAGD